MDRDQGWKIPGHDICRACCPCCKPLRQRMVTIALGIFVMTIELIFHFGLVIYQPATWARTHAQILLELEKKQGKLSRTRETMIQHYIAEMDRNRIFLWIVLVAWLPAFVMSCVIFPVIWGLSAGRPSKFWWLLFPWIFVLLGVTTPAQVYLLVKILMAASTHEKYPSPDIVGMDYTFNFMLNYVVSIILTLIDLLIIIHGDFSLSKFIHYTIQERTQVTPDNEPIENPPAITEPPVEEGNPDAEAG